MALRLALGLTFQVGFGVGFGVDLGVGFGVNFGVGFVFGFGVVFQLLQSDQLGADTSSICLEWKTIDGASTSPLCQPQS